MSHNTTSTKWQALEDFWSPDWHQKNCCIPGLTLWSATPGESDSSQATHAHFDMDIKHARMLYVTYREIIRKYPIKTVSFSE